MGSSHSFGNTRRIVNEFLLNAPNAALIDLNDYSFSYYDYDFKNASDDLRGLIENILEYETVIFATPIYWYTMSAQLKTFLDRLSDILTDENKAIGRRLRGKKMAVISCGKDDELFDGFTMPFKQTANYLGMVYLGHSHGWVESDLSISERIRTELKEFAEAIN